MQGNAVRQQLAATSNKLARHFLSRCWFSCCVLVGLLDGQAKVVRSFLRSQLPQAGLLVGNAVTEPASLLRWSAPTLHLHPSGVTLLWFLAFWPGAGQAAPAESRVGRKNKGPKKQPATTTRPVPFTISSYWIVSRGGLRLRKYAFEALIPPAPFSRSMPRHSKGPQNS